MLIKLTSADNGEDVWVSVFAIKRVRKGVHARTLVDVGTESELHVTETPSNIALACWDCLSSFVSEHGNNFARMLGR